MAVAGVSTQSSPFRHSTTSPPSILFSSYSIRRSLSVFSAFTPRPSSTFDRQEIHSQGSDAHSCDVTRVGSTKAVRASSSVYKITLNNGVHDPAYYSLPSSQKPEPPFSPINTNPYNSRSSLLGPSGTGIARENDCGNSKVPAFDLKYLCSRESWSRESQRNKYLRTSYQLCQNIVNGCCPDLQDGIAYKTENISTTFPSYHNTNALAEKYAIQDSSTQEYGNYSKKSSGALMGSASASHRQMQMGVNKTPLGCRVTLPSEDFFNKQSESPTQTVSNGALINKPLPQKRVAVGEEVLEMDGHRSNGAIEMNTDNIECPIPTPSSQTSTKLTGRQGDQGICKQDHKKRLNRIYDKVRVIDNVSSAREVVQMLTTKYKKFVHACDTEVAKIDVKQDTPVGHGEIICFSVFSGSDESKADFGDGKNCIWVDVLDGGRDVLMEFAKFFEDPLIKKVWHNYSFDSHVIENYGIKVSGFHADTMHLARLWDSSRGIDGGYSLEALTSDQSIMHLSQSGTDDELTVGKISMKSIFGKKKLKKDGSEGKIITIAPVETLQREERIPWICYSALDSISTLKLFQMLKGKLIEMPWIFDGGKVKGSMYDFYGKYWQPFGKLLVEMESEGMLVDRAYLAEIEKVASVEQKVAADRFRNWASKYCPDAKYMNVGSDNQIRQLLFGGVLNRKKQNDCLPESKTFKVPNVDNVVEEGKKSPLKYRNITLHCLKREIFKGMQTEMYTASGWPSVSGGALKGFAGKIASDQIYLVDGDEDFQSDSNKEVSSGQISLDDADKSTYGTAYAAFGGNKEGMEACHAIAALCEVCSIDSLISNFILPLQGDHISGHNGRIHCSLNINTETGRLSARRPNLQNQPALEKDRYKIRQAFIAAPGNSLIVADYGQLELRILAHLANCKSMLDAFKAGGDFHSRTAMNMYPHVREAVKEKRVLLEWHPQPGEDKPPVPLLKDAFAAERRKAKMLNFSIAYGKTPVGLSKDWKVSLKEAKETVKLWYKERQEVLKWQQKRKEEAREQYYVNTLLGRARRFPSTAHASNAQKGHIERAAINTPVQGSAADVAMCAMLQITKNDRLKDLKWKLLLQVHDEVILEGPTESAEEAKAIVVECMSKPFDGHNILNVDLSVDAKCAQNWYAAK